MTERPAVVTIGSDRLSASIDPFGAQLCALRDADGVNLLWDGNPAVWAGQAPILFPIVGMLNEGDYRLDGRTHHLPKHGFARHMLVDVAEAEARSVLLRLEADDRTMESYPFRFRLDLRFTIDGACLAVVASVRNLDKRPMPASFGFHPGFRWPLSYGEDRARHRLMFEQARSAGSTLTDWCCRTRSPRRSWAAVWTWTTACLLTTP
jgi:galactose mutarotase-like enzyme